MTTTASAPIDLGLLWLRLGGSALLCYVHGWPKLLHYHQELARIEDPFGLGPTVSMASALVAELLCPLLVASGFATRLACLPVLLVLAVAMLIVHPDWSIAQGQFGWLLMIIFGGVGLCGPGRYSLDALHRRAGS